jgi:hypothetical protein
MAQTEYVNLKAIRNNVKIWKFQTTYSALDVTAMLDSYRKKGEAENLEYRYSGRICFSINSKEGYQKAYIEKTKAKLLLNSIVNGTFSKLYTKKDPKDSNKTELVFEDYGGYSESGKDFSRKLSIRPYIDKNKNSKIAFNIEIFNGKKDDKGAFKAIGAPIKKTSSVMNPENLVEMAIEVLDYIRSAEVVAMSKKIPMNTLTSLDREPVVTQNSGQSQQPQQNNQSPVEIEKVWKVEEISNMEPKDFQMEYEKKKQEYKKFHLEFEKRKKDYEDQRQQQQPQQ